MKKVIKSLGLLLVGASVIVSCKKQEIDKNTETEVTSSKTAEVTHNYSFEDEEYTVTYVFDEFNELVRTGGDVETHKALIAKLGSPDDVALNIESVSEDGLTFDIRMFKTYDDLMEYSDVDESSEVDLREPCSNYTNGSSNSIFKFYQNTNYDVEYTFLRRAYNAYFQQQWLYGANDNISSLEIINGGSVRLFDGSCYSGMSISLQHSVPNLHYVHVGFFWFTPVYAGDFCASIKGYAY
jgi:hypothetical protein